MKDLSKKLFFYSIASAAFFMSSSGFAAPSKHAHPTQQTSKLAQTSAALRDLWVGHGFWTRNVAVASLAGNTAAAAAAEAEAVENAKQIAASIEPFYGKAASEKFFGLLGGHYGALKQYMQAAYANNASAQETATTALKENAEQIAVFLSSANPNLKLDGLRGMLMAHGGHHIQQIQQLRDKQYSQEAKTWAEMTKHMYAMADGVSAAIAKQFPAKFK